MSQETRRLPEYGKPPVNEVVIGVQFAAIEGFLSVHPGLFWGRIKHEYPNFIDRPPLLPVFEFFGEEAPSMPQVEVVDAPPLRRCWFLNSPEDRLVQLQPERFLHNWRKVKGTEEYPRYEQIRQEFESLWKDFLAFIEEEKKLGKVVPNQWEVTYVNHIYQGEGWDTLRDLPRLFRPWSGQTTECYLQPPETAEFKLSYAFPENHGRLHVRLDLRFRRPDNRKLLRLELTARGKLASAEVDDLLQGLDLGREWIVRGFTDLTTPEAHKLWERTDVKLDAG